MKELFYEIIKEARDGHIVIGEEVWPIGFNSVIYEKEKMVKSNFSRANLSTLVVKDLDKFMEKLDEYMSMEISSGKKVSFLNDRDNLKLILSYLFVNATTEDFLNPIDYLNRKIDYLKDDTFENYDLKRELDDDLLGCFLSVHNEKQTVMMETPNKMCFEISDGKNVYLLPTISYGFHKLPNGQECCYIYSLLNPKLKSNSDEENKFQKMIARKLYKVNKGVLEEESDEYREYVNGTKDDQYYPENISDVSPSAVISLSIFMEMLKEKNVEEIRGVSYLPLRYLSRNLAAGEVDDEAKRESLNRRNDKIQANITDKFIRTFRRVAFHRGDVTVSSYPYEFDEFVHVQLARENTKVNNEFLATFTKSVEKSDSMTR